jgi:hypothetical protein
MGGVHLLVLQQVCYVQAAADQAARAGWAAGCYCGALLTGGTTCCCAGMTVGVLACGDCWCLVGPHTVVYCRLALSAGLIPTMFPMAAMTQPATATQRSHPSANGTASAWQRCWPPSQHPQQQQQQAGRMVPWMQQLARQQQQQGLVVRRVCCPLVVPGVGCRCTMKRWTREC